MKKIAVLSLGLAALIALAATMLETKKMISPDTQTSSLEQGQATPSELPKKVDLPENQFFTEEEKTSYSNFSQRVDLEVKKLGNSKELAYEDAERDFQQFCSNLTEVDDRIKQAIQERNSKLAALDGSSQREIEVAKVIFNHKYELSYLNYIKYKCEAGKA